LARIGIASQALGISQAAMDCAIDYAGNLTAFGNAIIKLSAVQVCIMFTHILYSLVYVFVVIKAQIYM